MPRNPTTGDFVRVSNTFSQPVYGTVIDPTDADALFNDYDVGLTFDDASPLILVGSTSGVTTIKAADTASGTITLPAGTTDFSATGGTGQFVRQDSAGAPFTVTTVPASAIASGAALTRVDDTNVTLTLAGAPSTALLAATSITVGWTGTLGVSRGGTALSSLTAYNLIVGNGTGTPALVAPSATTGVPLISQGASANPAYGTAVVAGGGTGNTTFTAYSVICAGTTGTGAFQNVSGLGTSGQVLTSNGAGALPSWTSVSGTGTVTSVDAGAGMSFSSITTTGSVAQSTNSLTRDLIFIIDGGGAALTTGLKLWYEVDFNCTIVQATLLADQSGSVVVDVFKCTYAAYDPPTNPASGDKITASAPPTISAAKKSQDSTLTGWTTSISAGDVLAANVNSATTITRVTLILKVTLP